MACADSWGGCMQGSLTPRAQTSPEHQQQQKPLNQNFCPRPLHHTRSCEAVIKLSNRTPHDPQPETGHGSQAGVCSFVGRLRGLTDPIGSCHPGS